MINPLIAAFFKFNSSNYSLVLPPIVIKIICSEPQGTLLIIYVFCVLWISLSHHLSLCINQQVFQIYTHANDFYRKSTHYPLYLIRIIMKLDLAVVNVVGLQRIVHPLRCIVFNMLLQHWVPVNQEPAGHIENTVRSLWTQPSKTLPIQGRTEKEKPCSSLYRMYELLVHLKKLKYHGKGHVYVIKKLHFLISITHQIIHNNS